MLAPSMVQPELDLVVSFEPSVAQDELSAQGVVEAVSLMLPVEDFQKRVFFMLDMIQDDPLKGSPKAQLDVCLA